MAARNGRSNGAKVLDATYRLCPTCFRAVPARSGELYCANDGTRLLEQCPMCQSRISSPYARFCTQCGFEYAQAISDSIQQDTTP